MSVAGSRGNKNDSMEMLRKSLKDCNTIQYISLLVTKE